MADSSHGAGDAGNDNARQRRDLLAPLVVVGLALVALGALAWGGAVLLSAVSPEELGQTEISDTWDPQTFSAEISDLDALTAVPGTTFDSGDFADEVTEFPVDGNIDPGVYIARDAVPFDGSEPHFCFWAVASESEADGVPVPGAFTSFASVTDGTAMMLAPPGFFVTMTPECGVWEAIDPSEAFVGAEGSAITQGTYQVGRDVIPGRYVATEPVAEDSLCRLWRGDDFGFKGGEDLGHNLIPDGGTPLVLAEAGDVVEVRDCPVFELVDPETDLPADAGVDFLVDGRWLAGRDVAAGTYQAVPRLDGGVGTCTVRLWSDSLREVLAEPIDVVSYDESEGPATIDVEVGQVVEVRSCAPWELAP